MAFVSKSDIEIFMRENGREVHGRIKDGPREDQGRTESGPRADQGRTEGGRRTDGGRTDGRTRDALGLLPGILHMRIELITWHYIPTRMQPTANYSLSKFDSKVAKPRTLGCFNHRP